MQSLQDSDEIGFKKGKYTIDTYDIFTKFLHIEEITSFQEIDYETLETINLGRNDVSYIETAGGTVFLCAESVESIADKIYNSQVELLAATRKIGFVN